MFRYIVVFLMLGTPFILDAQEEVPEIEWGDLQKTEPWKASEQWDPVPVNVTPGTYVSAPSDAVVLFDGSDLSAWHKPKYGYGARMDQVKAIIYQKVNNPEWSEAEWSVKDGAMIVKPGSGAIETKQVFGDVQLHIEWLSPEDPGKEDQQYSNSGIFLMGLYEIQVLNSYENETYPNGQAGSMYKQHTPLVNASRPPGEWQTYDIVFNGPRFASDGSLRKPATITAFHNGVLIQNNSELKGPCIFIGEPNYIAHPEKMPLLLQDHGDKVRFRNIWIREL
ncbi:MAG: DUF1080 domain-containing protein [Saprospiraceae bacterium]|nr:DUF1080 domain-containing protein [Saprospiraceae bacterium]